MFAYKGFNKDLDHIYCRDQTYTIGDIYILNSGNIKLCTRGFHFCPKLSDVFNYYSRASYHCFGLVEVLGDKLVSSDKGCTNKIRVIKILDDKEIDEILKKEEAESLENQVYCLDILKELQSNYNFSIGGSTALFIHGYSLKRKKGEIDFDIIMPYYQNIKINNKEDSLIEGIEEFDGKSSGNDFSKTYALTTNDGRFMKLDIRIKPEQSYEVVKYKDYNFKVSDLMTILEAKCRYASEGNDKHKKDILSLIKKA